MILKRAPKPEPLLEVARTPSFLRRLLLGIALVSGLCAAFLGAVGYGMYLHEVKVADSLATFVEHAIETRLAIVPNFVRGRLAAVERITIDVKHKDFQRLAFKREQALERGLLLTSSDDFVPGRIRYRDKTVDVKLRLKGDWVDHLVGSKWSFRVKVRGDDTLFGMKTLSLHHPRTRNFVNEWIYHEALKREGVLALRYDFLNVTLNGKDLGVYALEEHFDKRLIEHQGHREGPILKFNEDAHWADLLAHGRKGAKSPTGLQAETASYVDGFRTKALLADPTQQRQFQTAVELLESFRARRLPTSRAFDVEKLAAYFAIVDLTGADHGANWINLRFYYNPITSLLEPIGFDGNAGKKIATVLGANRTRASRVNKFKDIAFSDPVFFREYAKALERVSSEDYLEQLFADLEGELQQKLAVLYREFPYLHFSKRVFYENQRTIRSALRPVRALNAHLGRATREALRLELANVQRLPLEVLRVRLRDGTVLLPDEPVILDPAPDSEAAEPVEIAFALPSHLRGVDPGAAEPSVEYRLLGLLEPRSESVFPWTRRAVGFDEEDLMRRPPNAESFEFLEIDEAARTISIRPGSWRLERELIVPSGYRLVCAPGTDLDLAAGASIVSYSPLEFRGSEDAPIRIHSSDGSGRGLAVLRAGAESQLEHVRFHNLSNPSHGGWEPTGAVTFYESPVRISHSEFASNRSEDGLNVIRSDFSIVATLFRDTRSDAFDADFADGSITRSSFVRAGNDAIDVSGSRVALRQIRVNGAGDKGVSGGENAQLSVDGLDVRDAVIGVASKDMSRIEVHSLEVRRAEIGLAVFQKKSEFGPASIEARELSLDAVRTPYLVETGSTLIVKGESIAANGERLREALYSAKGVVNAEQGG